MPMTLPHCAEPRHARAFAWLGALLALLAALCALPARAAGVGALIDAAGLARELANPGLLLLDASPAPLYAKGHIRGAVNVDLFGFGIAPATPAEMERRIQSWGVSPGRRIVVYDQGGSFFATRLYYDLLHHGYPAGAVSVLDGGLAKWRELGLATTTEPTPRPAPGSFRVERTVEELRVRLPEFLVASGEPERNALVEALEPASYYGEATFFDRGGHVPHALLMPSAEFFNPDKTFKSPDDIKAMARHLGVTPDRQVYTYCGGGIAASVPFFALKVLAGYPKVKLYQESQLEWMQDDRGLPLWTYAAPYLLRDTAWLRGWGGKTARMYGISQVSIVDVRAPVEYAQAHIPFALNLPAQDLGRLLVDPARLAARLGSAGVDPAHEAIVVSDGGITPDAALAWLALETAGQRRVSLYLPTLDQWAAEGQPVTSEPTLVAAAPGNPLAVRPSDYAAAPRPRALLADPARAPGAYPRVYLASGREAPARRPDGTVVHLPYTALLQADGRPKPARELWTLLEKAGVPRYAEIVCYADATGDAAAACFVLRLMGFADAKVWAG